MLTIRAMTDGKGYSARHLEHSDYYAEVERVKGQWRGRGAELLGLKGDVRQEEFEALREGLDPEIGAFLGRGKVQTERDPMARFSRMDATSTTSQFQRRNRFPLWRLWEAILG